jgi:hypothetical protein
MAGLLMAPAKAKYPPRQRVFPYCRSHGGQPGVKPLLFMPSRSIVPLIVAKLAIPHLV